jgi:16S rRNA (uracil1498-N3)-methyltransferase
MSVPNRLFVETPLSAGASVPLSQAQAHYALGVLRLAEGDSLLAFNGRDGEWRCTLQPLGRRAASLTCAEQTRPQASAPDITLAFAPIKGDRIDAIAEKATELGVAALQPVVTDRTIVRKLRIDRLEARCVEAAEQSGRLCVPEVRGAIGLDLWLAGRDATRLLVFADEAGDAPPMGRAVAGSTAPADLLIGPEGGFTPAERRRIRDRLGVVPVSLGPRILRADTAVFAGLALLQAGLGDWG